MLLSTPLGGAEINEFAPELREQEERLRAEVATNKSW